MQDSTTVSLAPREAKRRVHSLPPRWRRNHSTPPVSAPLFDGSDGELEAIAAPLRRRAFTSGSPSVIAHQRNADLVYAGWLCVEHNLKRAFKWRYCVLDGVQLTCFKNDKPGARQVRVHTLVAVERLHCINRALLLTDSEGYRLWLHVDHQVAHFERWLTLFSTAIEHEAKRRDGSLFARPAPLLPVTAESESTGSQGLSDLNVSFTGWLRMRKTLFRLKWLHSRAHRMYFVLSGRHLSGFAVNIEGRWVGFYGQIVAVRPSQDGNWLEVQLSGDARSIQLAGRSQGTTEGWRRRMQQVLDNAAIASAATTQVDERERL